MPKSIESSDHLFPLHAFQKGTGDLVPDVVSQRKTSAQWLIWESEELRTRFIV